MKFTKMHGAGNDFIIINIDAEGIAKESLPKLAEKLCARRTSVGADGLMAVTKPQNGGDFKMLFFNADGSEGEMCGNGARCIARYGYENGLAGNIQRIETVSSTVVGRLINERNYCVRMNDPTVVDMCRTAIVDGVEYNCVYIELGDPGLPHAVVELDTEIIPDEKLCEIGRKLRNSSAFPKGANVNFCYIIGENRVKAVTFERGVEDFTLACGTGASSIAAALTLLDKVTGKNVEIEMPGGTLEVSLTEENGNIRDIYLTGPTNIVAVGEITDEDM